MKNLSEVLTAARTHYENIQADIPNAKDRIEHIRLTTLAQGAFNLLLDLENLIEDSPSKTFTEPDEVLDLPEFKSPYNPDA